MFNPEIIRYVVGFITVNNITHPVRISIQVDRIILSIIQDDENTGKFTIFGPINQPKPGCWEGDGWSLIIKFEFGSNNNPIVQFNMFSQSDPFPHNGSVDRSWIYLYGNKMDLEIEAIICPPQPKSINLSVND